MDTDTRTLKSCIFLWCTQDETHYDAFATFSMLFFRWLFRFLFHYVASVRMHLGHRSIESLSRLSQTNIVSANEYTRTIPPCHTILVKWAQFVCTKPICLLCTQFSVLPYQNDAAVVAAAVVVIVVVCCILWCSVMYCHVKLDLLFCTTFASIYV